MLKTNDLIDEEVQKLVSVNPFLCYGLKRTLCVIDGTVPPSVQSAATLTFLKWRSSVCLHCVV